MVILKNVSNKIPLNGKSTSYKIRYDEFGALLLNKEVFSEKKTYNLFAAYAQKKKKQNCVTLSFSKLIDWFLFLFC